MLTRENERDKVSYLSSKNNLLTIIDYRSQVRSGAHVRSIVLNTNKLGKLGNISFNKFPMENLGKG